MCLPQRWRPVALIQSTHFLAMVLAKQLRDDEFGTETGGDCG